jgi:adenosine deaminase
MEILAEKNVALELCPTSNLNTAVFDSLDEYPLRSLMDAGIKVSINSDNMSVSATDLVKEFENLIKVFGLEDRELMQLANNAVDASWASEEVKEYIKSALQNG